MVWFGQLVSFGFGPFQTQIWWELVNEDLWKWHIEGFNAFQPPWKQRSIPLHGLIPVHMHSWTHRATLTEM